jgi:hypothetical protein
MAKNIGGVQSWSVGEYYPYTIVIRGGRFSGVCYALGPSGKGKEHPFHDLDCLNKQVDTFKQAHRKAEADARFLNNADNLIKESKLRLAYFTSDGSDAEPTDADLEAIENGEVVDVLTDVCDSDFSLGVDLS